LICSVSSGKEIFNIALYDDIGGTAAVRAALDAFYPRVLADAKLSPFSRVSISNDSSRPRRGSLGVPGQGG
jgi:truncated hemoglobin YjbI